MPFTPEHHRDEAEFNRKVLDVKIRIYRLAMDCCSIMKSIVEAEGSDDVECRDEYARKVDLSIGLVNDPPVRSVCIDIETGYGYVEEQCEDGVFKQRQRDFMTLNPTKVRKLLRGLTSVERETVADYLIPPLAHDAIGLLEKDRRYDEIPLLTIALERLYQEIITATLPVPAPPWLPNQEPDSPNGGRPLSL